MSVNEYLEQIRTPWLVELGRRLAQREGTRATLEESLAMFFDLLLRALQSNEPAWLESILSEWVEARTETELQKIQNTLTPILTTIQTVTFETTRRELGDQAAAEVMAAVLPIFAHALQYSSNSEMRLQVRHIQLELQEAQGVLERLEKSKSDFISVAAHELKTPLTLIEGYTSMLKELMPTEDVRRTQATACMRGINSGTHRLREIVDDMIDVSLIDNDLLALTFQPLWLNHLLGSVERELSEIIQLRRIQFEARKFPGSEEMFFGDGERLRQALRNVITNAIKYTPDKGSVVVDGRMLPGFVEVIITDSGIGIDPEDHSRIFEKFGRLGEVSLHSSGKTKFKGGGPGLGLPITKGIIEAHGGAIWVESPGYDEDKCLGSTFHIMLPLRKSPPDDHTAKLFRGMVDL